MRGHQPRPGLLRRQVRGDAEHRQAGEPGLPLHARASRTRASAPRRGAGSSRGCIPTSIGTHFMRCKGVPPPHVKCFTEYLRAAGYYCTNDSKTDYNFDAPLTAWDENRRGAHWRNRPTKETPFFAVINLTHDAREPDSPAGGAARSPPQDAGARTSCTTRPRPRCRRTIPTRRSSAATWPTTTTTSPSPTSMIGKILQAARRRRPGREHDRLLLGRSRPRAAAAQALDLRLGHPRAARSSAGRASCSRAA